MKKKIKVYVFGNRDVTADKVAFEVADKLKRVLSGMEFVRVNPNENLPFADGRDVIIMDIIQGLDKPALFDDSDLDKIVLPPRATAHDFDLGFQLKYLKKLGKLGKVTLIGLPMHNKIDYTRIHSILRKLVAQDMQGS